MHFSEKFHSINKNYLKDCETHYQRNLYALIGNMNLVYDNG